MKMTKKQFRSQFHIGPVSFDDIQPTYSETIHGYKIFRALQLLVLQDDEKFYVSRLS